jgi:hypothetical protein
MPSKTDIAKTVAAAVVGYGVSEIVKTIIQNNVQPKKIHVIVSVFCGSAILGMMAADASKNYTDAKIDEIVSFWNKKVKPRL